MNDEKSFEEYLVLYLNEIVKSLNEIGKSLKNVEKRLEQSKVEHFMEGIDLFEVD